MDMSRHPTAELPSASADVPRFNPDFAQTLVLAQLGQASCPTALALAFGTAPHYADDAERLRVLMASLAAGGAVPSTACGAFNRSVARRLAALQQGETGIYLGAEPRCKTLPAKAVLQQVTADPAPQSRRF